MTLQQDEPQDFVIATGVQFSVRQFIQWSAEDWALPCTLRGRALMKLPFETVEGDNAPAQKVGKVIIKIDPQYFRPTEVEILLDDPSKARTKLDA